MASHLKGHEQTPSETQEIQMGEAGAFDDEYRECRRAVFACLSNSTGDVSCFYEGEPNGYDAFFNPEGKFTKNRGVSMVYSELLFHSQEIEEWRRSDRGMSPIVGAICVTMMRL